MIYSKFRNEQGQVERRLSLVWDRWRFEVLAVCLHIDHFEEVAVILSPSSHRL